jgi:hypothetical protein
VPSCTLTRPPASRAGGRTASKPARIVAAADPRGRVQTGIVALIEGILP